MIILRRDGGMADTKDLKSFGQKCPCEFDSHLWYNFIYTKFFVVNELDVFIVIGL